MFKLFERSLQGIVVILIFTLPGCLTFKKIPNMPVGRQTNPVTGNYWNAEFSRKSRLNYVITFPEQYSGSGNPFPLILFLHSQAERGKDINLLIYEKDASDCVSSIALKEKDFPFITVSPLCPKYFGWPFLDRRLNLLLKDITKKYNINTSRIYLTGVSMGGMGTWSLAMDHPRWFAAVAPISGGIIFPMTIMKIRAIKNIPIWAFHDKNDSTIPIRFEQSKVARVKKAGGNIKYTVTETGRHDIWKDIYSRSDIFNWFLANEKRKTSK